MHQHATSYLAGTKIVSKVWINYI